MAEPGNSETRRVLHVMPSSDAAAQDIRAAIQAAGCEEAACPDVFRALARIGRAESGGGGAVVVCVDRIETGQLEFFQLLSRRCRDLRVYVYGAEHARDKLERAVGYGAIPAGTGEMLTEALTRSCARRALSPSQTVTGGQPCSDRTAPEPTTPAMPSIEKGEPVSPEAAEQIKLPEAEAGSARFPWLRYEDRPRRIPPSRSKPAEVPADAEQDAQFDPLDADGPLLSPEELEALIGDTDLSAGSSPDDPMRGS